MVFFKYLYIIFFSFLLSISFPILTFSSKSKDLEKRIVSLNSLGADIVSQLDNKSLIGIPGSPLLKKEDKFADKIIISEGRMPPSLEKIIKLKPTLVIGSAGFHDRILEKLNEFNIETLKTNTKSIDQLEILIKDLAIYLNKNPKSLNQNIKSCYFNTSLYRGSVVLLASTKPLLAPNTNSWAGRLLDRFNFDNISKDLESKTEFKGYVNLSPEVILKNKPSKIFVISFPGMNQTSLLDDPILKKIIKSNKNEVVTFDYYGLINPGSLKTINNACEKLSNI